MKNKNDNSSIIYKKDLKKLPETEILYKLDLSNLSIENPLLLLELLS
jgi:hypothetical protein